MANYDARINVTANVGQADRELRRLQGRLSAVERAANLELGDIIRTGGLQRSIATVNQLDRAVSSLRSSIRSINSPGGGSLGDAIRVAATASNQFFDSLARGDRYLSNTISGLREQSNAFAVLASNINSASDRFTDYVQGAQAAQDKGLQPLFRQFEALRQLYEEGVTGRGIEINTAEMGAGFFERLSQEVPQTEAALRAFSAELTRVRGLIGSESVAAFGIEQQIIEIEQQLLRIEQDRLETRAALNREMSAPVQGALSRMEGRQASPFGVPDEQINEVLNQRAEEYIKQREELSSLQQVLFSMESKRYDPLNITDEQINQGLNERAIEYEKQANELSALDRILSSMEGRKFDPLGVSDEQINQALNLRAQEYVKQQEELSALQRVLSSMEGRRFDPLGISDEQVNQGLNQRASDYERQTREIAALQQALGTLEQRKIDWGTALGIDEAELAARRARELEAEWNRLDKAAQALAAQAPQAAAALRAFKFETLAKNADAYTRALLNQQRTLDEYTDSANRAARAASELGYGGGVPALRPAGFTNQDVRIKNLLDDQQAAAKIVAELEVDLGKMVNNLELENIQREMMAEIDSIEKVLERRKKAGEEWWAGEKARLDARDAAEQASIKRADRLRERSTRAVSEGLIGGAFPLLFGQGLGAAVLGGAGGAIGGFAGGGFGFGLSLIGTALGTAFDQLNQAAQETGNALRYPVEGFEQLKQAGLLASRQQEYYISKLIEAGRVTEAAGKIQDEIIKKIGTQGVQDLQRLGDSSSRLSKAWAEFNLQLQAALAGPMAGLLNWVTGIVAVSNNVSREAARQQDILSGLSPEDRRRLQAEEQRILSGANLFNEAERRQQVSQLYGRFEPRARIDTPDAQLTPEQRDAQKRAQAVTRELQAQVELQSRQLSLTGLTLERDGARYVNAAKAVALQEYDNKLLEIKNSWIGKAVTEQQKLAQLRGAELDYAMQLKQINEEIARRQEELYQNSLQAEMALYQQRQKSIELIVRYAEFNSGEEAGLRERLSLADNMRQQKLAEFYVEEELALIAAQKNGTYEQTATLYAERLLALEKELALEEAIAAQRIIQLQFSKALAIEDAKRQAIDPFTQFRESQQLDEQFARNYFRLLQEGIAPAEAERLANFERLVSEQMRSLDIQIAIAQSTYDEAVNRGLVGDALKTYADNLERLQKARDAAREEAARGAGPAPQELPGMKIQEFISTAEEELRDLESVAISISERIGDAVGNSISSGISGLIEGTKTAQEVFADFLKNIGEILISEGAKIIATYVAIGLARQFAGLFGGGVSGGAGGAGASDLPTAITSTLPIAANGAYFANGVAAFAKGGMFTNSVVSSPTLFQFADGGALRTGLMGEAGPEAIMPLKRGPDGRLGVDASGSGGDSKMFAAMSRYASGARGSSVIPANGSNGAAGSIAANTFTLETVVINNVEYATVEQVRAMGQQAARQGASQGHTKSMRTLQNSRSQRSKLGMR